jgi:S1-C subfamily serine protease
VTVAIAALVGSAAGLGAVFLSEGLPGTQVTEDGTPAVPISGEETIAQAAATAVPSVVNIDITGESDTSELPTDHPGVPIVGSGSGVAYRQTADGGTYIVTNHHVVQSANKIVITDSEGERYDGTLVGMDEDTDIAVVRIDATIPAIALGDSEDLVVGQTVIAIGAPFGLGHSVTAGVVSAIHRSLTGISSAPSVNPLVDVIQTDAAINPGNSGGALVDRSGNLVGIPTAIYSQTGGSDSIGFAVNVRTATRVADQLIEFGVVQHPFLGVQGVTITPLLAQQESLASDEGVLIAATVPGTEAEKAGITEGDIIVSVDGSKIRSMEDLLLEVRRRVVGDSVTISLYRDGELIEVPMLVGAKPKDVDQ